jgi:hypothetical protein
MSDRILFCDTLESKHFNMFLFNCKTSLRIFKVFNSGKFVWSFYETDKSNICIVSTHFHKCKEERKKRNKQIPWPESAI